MKPKRRKEKKKRKKLLNIKTDMYVQFYRQWSSFIYFSLVWRVFLFFMQIGEFSSSVLNEILSSSFIFLGKTKYYSKQRRQRTVPVTKIGKLYHLSIFPYLSSISFVFFSAFAFVFDFIFPLHISACCDGTFKSFYGNLPEMFSTRIPKFTVANTFKQTN